MYRNTIERLEGRVLFSTLPAGFTETNIATFATSVSATMAFAPDGRLFVGDTTNNQIRLVKNGALQPNPVLNLAVAHQSERGINGIEFDPNFASAPAGQKYVYIYYTTNATTPVNRLSRFTISTTNADTLDPASEKILLDNIASTNGNHNGGMLRFGADGKLYLGVGEAGIGSNAQTLANLSGKILRINPDGTIPADNPFVGVAGARGEIWSLGMRNPFTGAVKPGTSQVYVNNVGGSQFEEINLAAKGGNFGWPTVEGVSNNPSFINPIYTYPHGGGAAIAGAAFYTGSNFPASYSGKYFFGDYIQHRIWSIDVNSPPAQGQATTFATGTLAVVDLDVNPIDGSLWYLDVAGQVQKIAFTQTPPPNNDQTLTATAAAYVKDGSSANANFGSTTDLQVKKSTPGFNRESFLRFDLTTATSALGSAKLRVFGNLSSAEASSVALSVFGVASTGWAENAITFNNKPAGGASAIASVAINGTTPRWYDFDVTAYAKANAGKVVSFDLRAPNSALPVITFNSDEAATNKPQLVISPFSSTGSNLAPSADAYVRDGSSANSNFGVATSLQIKKSTPGFTREAYLRFDLSSIAVINSAKLRLFGGFEASPGSARIAAFGLDNPAWTEPGITYNNRPTGGTQLSTVTFTDGSQAIREWDLTSYLKAQKALGHNVVTIALRALDGSTPAASFASDEAAANKPVLVIS